MNCSDCLFCQKAEPHCKQQDLVQIKMKISEGMSLSLCPPDFPLAWNRLALLLLLLQQLLLLLPFLTAVAAPQPKTIPTPHP